jgi:outer membrane protein TolC
MMRTGRSVRQLVSLVLLAGITAGAVAADTDVAVHEAAVPAAVKTWSIDDCLSRAREQNPSVRAARAGLKSASGTNLMAVSEFVPRVSWSTVYVKNDKTMLGSLGSSIPGLSPAMTSEDYYVSSLSADLTLFSWRLKPLRSTLNSSSTLARMKLAAAENDLTLNVKKAFYTALYAQQALRIARSAEDVAQENLETSENLYRIGRVSSFDVSRARVRAVNAKTEVISARNFEAVSVEGLRMLLSLSAGEGLAVGGEFSPEARDVVLEHEIASALRRRPELNSAKEAEVLQKAAKEVARAGFLPVVFAGFSYSWEGLALTMNKDDYYTSWTAKAGISIPLFDGLYSIGRFSSAKAALEQAREQVRAAQDGVLMEVRQSYYSLANARESLLAQKENVETAAENLRIAQERYKLGLLSLLELKDAELSLIGARTQQVKALYDYTVSLASLDRAVGLPSSGN